MHNFLLLDRPISRAVPALRRRSNRNSSRRSNANRFSARRARCNRTKLRLDAPPSPRTDNRSDSRGLPSPGNGSGSRKRVPGRELAPCIAPPDRRRGSPGTDNRNDSRGL